jgi:Family of unknown function (DUF5677)
MFAMTLPDAGDGLARLDELIAEDLHLHVNPASPSAVVGWGLFFNCLHQIEAILRLHTHGHCFAAAPNRRCAIEYALYLVWLADEGDHVVDVLNRGFQREQQQLANRLRSADLVDQHPPEAFQVLLDTLAVELAPEPDERLLSMAHLLDEYGLAGLKPYYQAESRFTHVSLTAIRQFAQDGDGDTLYLGQRPFNGELVPCQDFCLPVLFDAMLAFDSTLVGQPWNEALRQIGADHNLPTVLPSRRPR